MISFLRYQYDYKHYPQFCNYNNNQFSENDIEYMRINLELDYGLCDYDLKYTNLTKYDTHTLYLENIWYDFGSCTNMNIYDYFNKTLVLFYQNRKKMYNCYYDDYTCKQYFNNNFELLIT